MSVIKEYISVNSGVLTHKVPTCVLASLATLLLEMDSVAWP